jgi:hypothetical protein
MSGRRGRPARPGERFPSGDRRDADDARAGTLWRRIVDHGTMAGVDPRLATQVGRLRLLREITDTQAAAADLVGRIYGRYERLKGLYRSTRSPSYQLGAARGWRPDDVDDAEAEAKADAVYRRLLDECIPLFPRETRDAIEQLCVEDRHVGALMLPQVRAVLDRVAQEFGLESSAASAGLRRRRRDKFTRGAYASAAKTAPPSTLDGDEAEVAARDRADTVRQMEAANARRVERGTK